jgi:hypothetical protein
MIVDKFGEFIKENAGDDESIVKNLGGVGCVLQGQDV